MRPKRPLYLYVIAIVASVSIWVIYKKLLFVRSIIPQQLKNEHVEVWSREQIGQFKNGCKIILLYTTWFERQTWYDFKAIPLDPQMHTCLKANNCILAYGKSWINQAAGVVFHGRDVEEHRKDRYSPSKLREIRKAAPDSQKWIFLSHENPNKDVNVYRPFDGIFNWTATFSRKSNIFVPYSNYIRKKTPFKELRNYAKEKTGLVAWAVSNCRSKVRLDYVLQLQRYVDVTVYGRCNCYFEKKRNCKHFDKSCQKELSSYKFYLAFENDFCHDYVTEKYWERIEQDVVPVVMGSNYGKGVVIPGSYINAQDFDSIKQLAEYLLYLDKNDDEYNKYFAYKIHFKMVEADFYCDICEQLNSDEAKKHSQVKLSEEINYERNCGVKQDMAKKIKKQVDDSAKSDSFLKPLLIKARCWVHSFFS